MSERYPLLTELILCVFQDCFPGDTVYLYMRPKERWDWDMVPNAEVLEAELQAMDPDQRLSVLEGDDVTSDLFGFSCWILCETNQFVRI